MSRFALIGRSHRNQLVSSSVLCPVLFTLFYSWIAVAISGAQSYSAQQYAAAPESQQLTDIEQRLNSLTDKLTETQKALQQSLQEIQH
jgi:hypothetical protein